MDFVQDISARGVARLQEFTRDAVNGATWPPSDSYMERVVLPLLLSLAAIVLGSLLSAEMRKRVWGREVKVPGPGIAFRHARFPKLVEKPLGAATVPELFDAAVERYPNKPLLGTRRLISLERLTGAGGKAIEEVELGEYEWETYSEVRKRARALASGLFIIGHAKGERIAIFAETRAEWFIALQAAYLRSLEVVTVYASLGEDALVHSLNETEVRTVVVDLKQLEKVASVAAQLRSVRRIVLMEDPEPAAGSGDAPPLQPPTTPSGMRTVTFSSLEEMGRKLPVDPDLPSPGDVAVIMYTSGSTGLPKGVVISHKNVVATTAAVLEIVPGISEEDIVIGYLPLAHILELCGEIGLAAKGAAIGFGSPLTLIDTSSKIKPGTKGDAPTLHPTLMACVPAVMDRIRAGVLRKVDSLGPRVKRVFGLAYRRRLAAVNGSWLGAWGPERLLWERLVFSKIRAALGGRVRFMLSGGAPLSPDTQRFMQIVFGMGVGQGYGLTETCAGGTFTEWDDPSVGRVGPPIPCCHVKLIDWAEGGYLVADQPLPRGEICIGGPNVTMGYFKQPEKTQESYKMDKNGTRWFHTGDVGQFHPDGSLEIIDRKKDIVKLQAGEYVSLGKVEAVLQRCPCVDNIMMHADSTKSYAVALVVVNPAAVTELAPSSSSPSTSASSPPSGSQDGPTLAQICEDPKVVDKVLAEIKKVAKESKLEKFEVPQKIKLLPDPWLPETGLVTAAFKLKREVIRKTFADELKTLYS